MTLSKYNIRIIILLYVFVMFNLRYYLTVLLNPKTWREVMQHSAGNPRLITLLAIYVPIVALMAFGILIVRCLSAEGIALSGQAVVRSMGSGYPVFSAGSEQSLYCNAIFVGVRRCLSHVVVGDVTA